MRYQVELGDVIKLKLPASKWTSGTHYYMLTQGCLVKVSKELFLHMWWEENKIVSMAVFLTTDPDKEQCIKNMPHLDLDRGVLSGPNKIKVTAEDLMLFKEAKDEFIKQFFLIAPAMKKLALPNNKDDGYLEPDPKCTYILIDGEHLYISDPQNTPMQLQQEQISYELNNQTYQIINKDHVLFKDLKIPLDIRKVII